MIHIVGAGNIGSLFAVALSRRNAVQFLLKPASLKSYVGLSKSSVTMHTPAVGGADWEVNIPAITSAELDKPIANLLVAVKAHDIEHALVGLKPAITKETEIIVLHNGMGVREKLHSIWPNDETRPQIGYGVTNAGVKRHKPHWVFDYTGNGSCIFNTPSETSRMSSLLKEARELVVSEWAPQDVFELEQKRKLAVNSVINPLTAVIQCPNGALLSLDNANLMRRVLNESCRVLELDRNIMWDVLVDVIEKTRSNLSSMLCDVEQGRTSEIDFINGYIVEEARRQQSGSPLNLMLKDLVGMKLLQSRHELQSVIPLELDSHKN